MYYSLSIDSSELPITTTATDHATGGPGQTLNGTYASLSMYTTFISREVLLWLPSSLAYTYIEY